MRILLVDVDLTVAPSDEGWREYLGGRYGYVKTPMVEYNWACYYPEKPVYEYWKDLDYFSMQPLVGSFDKLKALSQYFHIVFVSAERCGYSSKNKKSWLKEHFPFMSGYIQTEEKWVVDSEKVVAIIDDRMDNLSHFCNNKRVLFKTPYKQSVDCSVNMVIDNWKDFSTEQFCKEYLK